MDSSSEFLITLGSILLFGLLASAIGHRTFLPRVTLLLLFGAIIGHEGLDIIPPIFADRFDIIADMALMMIGFLLGEKLSRKSLKNSMGEILWISISAAFLTAVFVCIGLVVAGASVEVAIILGCIASATAPAAILDAVLDADYKGPFKDILLSVVAIDDIWSLLLFGIGIAVVSTLNGHSESSSPILVAAQDIGGAALLGLLIGFPAAFFTGRIKPGQPILSEALGLVFVCGGVAIWLDVSFLIAVMVMGAVVANVAEHHEHPFHAIEDIEWPFMVVFFVLAGASLEYSMAAEIGWVGLVYIVCRIAGKVLGATIGCQLSKADANTNRWIGIALLPQAGIPIGMALIAANYFPQHRQTLLAVVIGSTVVFEIIGPLFTRIALQKTDLLKTKSIK